MKKPNLIQSLRRWRLSVVELRREVASLRSENERLRDKLASLQAAKEQAERHAEDRRREKESLRARLGDQRRAVELTELSKAQLVAKITELRTENDELRKR